MFSDFRTLEDGQKIFDGDIELVKFKGEEIPIYHKPECKCCCECFKCQGYTTWNRYVIAVTADNKYNRYLGGYSLGDFLQKNNLRIENYGEKVETRDIIHREMEIERAKYGPVLNFTDPTKDIYGNDKGCFQRFCEWIAWG